MVAVYATESLGRPSVKWTGDRSESFLADVHGRDHGLAARRSRLSDAGRILAMRASIAANIGAYCSQAGPVIPWFGACMTTGAYDIPHVHVDIRMMLTNTVPVDAYRGAGRPEATYLIERLMDRARCSQVTGIDRIELRRRNFIRPERFPYTTATGRSYDSGEYAQVLDAALQRAGWDGFAQRRDKSRQRGRLRGIGLAYYVEICSAMGGEDTHLSFTPAGHASPPWSARNPPARATKPLSRKCWRPALRGIDGAGASSIRTGNSGRVADRPGAPIVLANTMAIAGSSLYRSVERLVAAGRETAAGIFGTTADGVAFADGEFRDAGTNRRMTSAEGRGRVVATSRRARPASKPGLAGTARFEPDGGTYPNGCHVCEVEIDPETGMVEIVRYTIEDDVGVVINPLILEGQIVGGVAQGLGQALTEHALYDPDSGQLISATFMDYGMPRADWMPPVDFRYREVPSPRNPLGVKGAGEAGTVGAAPALVSAVLDALPARGIEHLDMPLSPQRVWRALQAS
ncbi:MAG: molybdopterin cofactor-binding domain-containing protein [Woeseiaceae bacterium]|nr:molybdopterin cofactor-binding domain-containing protein [Woeseiaceae bacterium]